MDRISACNRTFCNRKSKQSTQRRFDNALRFTPATLVFQKGKLHSSQSAILWSVQGRKFDGVDKEMIEN